MKKILLIAFLCCLIALPVMAKKKKKQSKTTSKYFDAVKVYDDRDFVLNDTLEFSLFDMSEVKLINDSRKVKGAGPGQGELDALSEVQADMENLPTYFYKSLKEQVLREKVPVTLFPDHSPSYAKPLQLYIKIKRIHLKPHVLDSDGLSYRQPFSMRVYGQVTDRGTGEVLVKFYDSAAGEFVLGKKQASQGYQELTDQIMKDLAAYLRTKY